MADIRAIRKDVHVRLCIAAARGTGVRLSADDVESLCRDEAITAAAMSAITSEFDNGHTPEDVVAALDELEGDDHG